MAFVVLTLAAADQGWSWSGRCTDPALHHQAATLRDLDAQVRGSLGEEPAHYLPDLSQDTDWYVQIVQHLREQGGALPAAPPAPPAPAQGRDAAYVTVVIGPGHLDRDRHAALLADPRYLEALDDAVRGLGYDGASAPDIAYLLDLTEEELAASLRRQAGPDGYLVLVAHGGDGTIGTFTLDPEAGSLTPLATSPVGAGCNTFAIDPHRDLVYASSKAPGEGIVTLALDRATGTLTRLGVRPTEAPMTYLALHPDRAVLLGASYAGGFAATYPLDPDGTVGPEAGRLAYPKAHAFVPSPDGRHAYAVSLGADLIAHCALGPAGELTPLTPATVAAPAGSGPRHLVFGEDGRACYVICEHSGQVLHYLREAAGGGLTPAGMTAPVGGRPTDEEPVRRWAADLHLARGGGWLWWSDRSDDTVTTVPLGADGRPEAASARIEVPGRPRGFAVSPDGSLVVVAGEAQGLLGLYATRAAGRLRPVARVATGAGPNWVRIIAR